MFGKAQGQKENPGLAKPSQTLRGCAIFDKRMLKLSGHAGRGRESGHAGRVTLPGRESNLWRIVGRVTRPRVTGTKTESHHTLVGSRVPA